MCGGLFTSKKTENTNTSQQGNSNTQNNLWPQLDNFLTNYNQQYTPESVSSVQAPVNEWQTGAVSNQSGLYAPTANIANSGISQSDINRFMSPYIQSVVNPTLQVQNTQNQQALSNLAGNQALKGALGNNTGAAAAYLAGVQPGQQAEIASLYNQGYGQAVNTAGQSAGLQLQGAQTGSGVNQNQFNMGEAIRQAGLQNLLTPFSLYNQGIQGYQGLGSLAGQNTQTSGTSTGTGTTSATPSTGSILSGLLGTALSAFSDERVKENIKPIGETFDGQPIYKYNMIGSPQTQIGLMAQDVEQRDPGAVGEVGGIKTVDYDRATKGAEPEGDAFTKKVMTAFRAIQGLRKEARADGGPIGSWTTTVKPEQASMFNKKSIGDFGKGLQDYSTKMDDSGSDGSSLGSAQQGLSQFLSGVTQANRPMYPYGGSVNDYSGVTGIAGGPSGSAVSRPLPDPRTIFRKWMGAVRQGEMRPYMDRKTSPVREDIHVARPSFTALGDAAPTSLDENPTINAIGVLSPEEQIPSREMVSFDTTPASSETSDGRANLGASDVPPPPPQEGWWERNLGVSAPYSTGVWAGEEATPMQRFGAALTQIGANDPIAPNPFSPYGQFIYAQQKQRLEDQLNQPKIDLMRAQEQVARTQSDKEFLLDIEKRKMQYAKELEIQQMKNKINFIQNLKNLNPGAFNQMVLGNNVPTPGSNYVLVPAVSPEAEAPVEEDVP